MILTFLSFDKYIKTLPPPQEEKVVSFLQFLICPRARVSALAALAVALATDDQRLHSVTHLALPR